MLISLAVRQHPEISAATPTHTQHTHTHKYRERHTYRVRHTERERHTQREGATHTPLHCSLLLANACQPRLSPIHCQQLSQIWASTSLVTLHCFLAVQTLSSIAIVAIILIANKPQTHPGRAFPGCRPHKRRSWLYLLFPIRWGEGSRRYFILAAITN